MSTILKALRRIEQERSDASERPLRDEVVLARSRPRRSFALPAVAAAAAVGFAATWLVLAGLGREAAAPVAAPAPAAAVPAPAAAAATPGAPPPAPRPAPTPALAGAPRGAPPGSAGVASPPPQPGPPAPGAPAGAAGVPDVAVVTPGARAAAPGPTAAAPSASAPAERVIVPPLPRPIPRVVDEPDPPPPPPSLRVQVMRTSWHPHPARRTALVRLEDGAEREIREGERIAGYTVREIDPEGVVFGDGPLEIHRPTGAP